MGIAVHRFLIGLGAVMLLQTLPLVMPPPQVLMLMLMLMLVLLCLQTSTAVQRLGSCLRT